MRSAVVVVIDVTPNLGACLVERRGACGSKALLFQAGVKAFQLAVVFVGFSLALFPLLELAGGEFEPAEQPLRRLLGARRPMFHVVDDLIARFVGNPASVQPHRAQTV